MSSIVNRFETHFDPTGQTRRCVAAGAIYADNAEQAAAELAESLASINWGDDIFDSEPLPTEAECLEYIQAVLADR